MAMTRQDRVNLHTKQDKILILDGAPLAADLKEGVPTLRKTKEGLVEYVKHENILYKNVMKLAAKADVAAIGSTKTITQVHAHSYFPTVPDYDSDWFTWGSEGTYLTKAHSISGIVANDCNLFYILYSRFNDTPYVYKLITADIDPSDTNDSVALAFDATNFYMHVDRDDSDSDIIFPKSGGSNLRKNYEDCDYRILAWKIF